MASVALKGIHKAFQGTVVVPELNLDIEDGEFLVLVGPSGCGKSTSLRMIAGLERPTRGQVFIGGDDVTDVAPRDRDVGMVFQSYALYPHMNVAQNIGFGLKLRGLKSADISAKVQAAADKLDLGHLLERKPSQLSGGQRQRVAMGRVLVREPRVFLFDEPLSNLDASLRVQMRSELSALHREVGTTSVYVTHDQIEAMTLGTRIAVLNEGILQQVAPPLELFHRPANRFVAGFMGAPTMNFIDGSLQSEGQNVGLSSSGKFIPLSAVEGALHGERSTLGIRPSCVQLVARGSGYLSGTVELVEPMGWETRVHLVTELGLIVAQQSGDSWEAKPGDEVGVRWNADESYLFNGEGVTVGFPTSGLKDAVAC